MSYATPHSIMRFIERVDIDLPRKKKQRDKIDGQRATNAMYRYKSANKAYKKAKSHYKNLKKNC